MMTVCVIVRYALMYKPFASRVCCLYNSVYSGYKDNHLLSTNHLGNMIGRKGRICNKKWDNFDSILLLCLHGYVHHCVPPLVCCIYTPLSHPFALELNGVKFMHTADHHCNIIIKHNREHIALQKCVTLIITHPDLCPSNYMHQSWPTTHMP